MVWISRSGSASRLRSLKTLPTKCTPVYSLRVNAQIVNNFSFTFFISKLMIDRYVMFVVGAVFSKESSVCSRGPIKKWIGKYTLQT